MKAISLLILCLIIQALSASAGVSEMEKLKRIYEQQLNSFAMESRGERLRLPKDHIAAMRELENRFQQSGELKELLAVRSERERFIGNPSIEAISPVFFPSQLRVLQEAYIKNYNSVSEKLENKTSDLREKYIRALTNLQKELTKKGKIESALVVMKEIEKTINSAPSTGNTAAAGSDFQPINNQGANGTVGFEDLIKGKVIRWNSYTREITIEYDFSDENQMDDWKGGKWNSLKRAIECDRTVAWARPQFEEITFIACDSSFEDSNYKSGIVVGNDLQAHISGGSILQGKLFQSVEDHHVINFTEPGSPSKQGHRSEIRINGNSVELRLDQARTRRGMLETPIRYPTYIGFGVMDASSSYNNITITGILSETYVSYLKRQAN